MRYQWALLAAALVAACQGQAEVPMSVDEVDQPRAEAPGREPADLSAAERERTEPNAADQGAAGSVEALQADLAGRGPERVDAEPGEAEGGRALAGDGSRPVAEPARLAPARVTLELRPVEVEEAEDGHGSVIPASRPMALDLGAAAWPGRALDPVLHVGPLVFRHYRHPGPGVLRFVAADAAALPSGAEVWLQYGELPAGRVTVTRSLVVPR